VLDQPFFQVTLPLMVTFIATIWLANWPRNKRFEDFKLDMNRRLDEIVKRLERLENLLTDHSERIVKLENARWR
jgi:23S rRNA C2498 (ribose-2'-O)-methylase RlmM